jgi:hypothetical protein
MSKKQRRGQAKVDFLACKVEIEKLLEEGFSVALIYDMFIKKGKITVGYEMFCRYMRRYVGTQRSQGKRKNVPAADAGSNPPSSRLAARPQPTRIPQDISAPGTPFVHEPRIDPALYKKHGEPK